MFATNAARAGAVAVNAALTSLYWQVGRDLQDDVLRGERAGKGQQIVPELNQRRTAEYGGGWSEQQLRH